MNRHMASSKLPLRIHLAVFLVFLVLTLLVSQNLLPHLNTAVIGADMDVHINMWADWWTQKALSHDDLSLWHTDYLYYPQGADLSYHSFSHLTTLVSLALKNILGATAAYNVTILLNYALSGLAMFHLAHYLTKNASAGVLAGIVFAFNTHNLYQSAHPVLVSVWCFPWVTLYLLRAMRERSWQLAMIAALFVGLGAATSTLLLFLMIIWVGALLAFCWIYYRPETIPWREIGIFTAVAAGLGLPFVWPLLRNAFQGDSSFVIAPMDSIPLDMIAPLLPPWIIWASWTIYFGIVPIILLVLARHQGKRAVPWYLLLGASYLLAIGPNATFLQQPLGFSLPWSAPIVLILRNAYRLSILISLALAMLVAFGWITLSGGMKNGRKQTFLFVIIAALIFVDYTAGGMPFRQIPVSEFYTSYLDDVPDDVALAVLPEGRSYGKTYLYYQMFHEHKITGGVVSRSSADEYAFIEQNGLLRAGAADWEPRQLPANILPEIGALADAGIGYLVLHKNQMEIADLTRWRAVIPLQPTYEDDLVLVYATE